MVLALAQLHHPPPPMAMESALGPPAHRGSESPRPGPGGKHLGCRSGLTPACCAVAKICADHSGLHGVFPLVSCSDGNCANLERVHSRHSIPEGVTPPGVPPWPQTPSPHPPQLLSGGTIRRAAQTKAGLRFTRFDPHCPFQMLTCLPVKRKTFRVSTEFCFLVPFSGIPDSINSVLKSSPSLIFPPTVPCEADQPPPKYPCTWASPLPSFLCPPSWMGSDQTSPQFLPFSCLPASLLSALFPSGNIHTLPGLYVFERQL